jgi:dinuclear metal center YbgI/SA1388 family protein
MAGKQDIISSIGAFAPLELAESWDNCGVLVDGKDKVESLTIILDPTVDELDSISADFILSHHPLIFSPLKRIELDIKDKVSMLLRKNQTFFAAHTNLDYAPEGISWALARALELEEDESSTPAMRTGTVRHRTVQEFGSHIQGALGTEVIKVVGDVEEVGRVAVMPGSGFHEETIEACFNSGISTVVSGDLKHHAALKGLDLGMTLIDAGHRETELPGLRHLEGYLRTRHPDVEISISIPKTPWHYVVEHDDMC